MYMTQPPSPKFSVYVYCGQMAGWIKMPLGMEVGLGPGYVVPHGDPAPLPKKGAQPPQFLGHVYCAQTAGWIKMPLGTKVGLGPGHIMLHWDPAPLPQKGHSPQFSVHVYCGQTVAISATAEHLYLMPLPTHHLLLHRN